MRRTTLALVLTALASLTAMGQSSDEETARLRDRLSLPASTSIVTSKSAKLPAGSTLSVYIEAGRDRDAYGRFEKWVDKWNKGDAKRYGSLQIVQDVSRADVILARFVSREDTSVLRRTTIDVGPGSDPTARPTTKTTVGTRLYTAIPLYSYLITRTPGALTIVYRNVDRSHIEDRDDPDGRLMSELGKRIKDR